MIIVDFVVIVVVVVIIIIMVTPIRQRASSGYALWARSTKNPDQRTGPLACPFARSLAPLSRSLAPHYLLRSRAPLRSLSRSLARFAQSLAGTVNG